MVLVDFGKVTTEETGALGKWGDPSVPKRGWICGGIDDLREDRAICEMCEVTEIRFVHYMSHTGYDDLAVGCICAGHMEQDTAAAKARERHLVNAARRRARWISRAWRTSGKGNEYLNTDGFNVVVFPKQGGWSSVIKHIASGETIFAKRNYPSVDGAKLAGFDRMIFMINKPRP
jgi:hypothetical protein